MTTLKSAVCVCVCVCVLWYHYCMLRCAALMRPNMRPKQFTGLCCLPALDAAVCVCVCCITFCLHITAPAQGCTSYPGVSLVPRPFALIAGKEKRAWKPLICDIILPYRNGVVTAISTAFITLCTCRVSSSDASLNQSSSSFS